MPAKDKYTDKEEPVSTLRFTEGVDSMQEVYKATFRGMPNEKLRKEYTKLLWQFSTEEGRLDYRRWMVETMGWCATQEEINKVQGMKLSAGEDIFRERNLPIPKGNT